MMLSAFLYIASLVSHATSGLHPALEISSFFAYDYTLLVNVLSSPSTKITAIDPTTWTDDVSRGYRLFLAMTHDNSQGT